MIQRWRQSNRQTTCLPFVCVPFESVCTPASTHPAHPHPRALGSPAAKTDCCVGFNKAWRLSCFTRRLHAPEEASQCGMDDGGRYSALKLSLLKHISCLVKQPPTCGISWDIMGVSHPNTKRPNMHLSEITLLYVTLCYVTLHSVTLRVFRDNIL